MVIAKSRAGSRPIRCFRLTTISLIIELLPWRQRSHRGIVAIRPGAGLDTDQPTGPLIDRRGAAIRCVHALLRNKIGPPGFIIVVATLFRRIWFRVAWMFLLLAFAWAFCKRC